MSQTMPSTAPRNRRLRRRHPDLANSTPKEIAADAASLAYLTLVSVLARDEAFMAAVATIRDNPDALDRIARRYVAKAGAGRRVIARMLSTAAAAPDDTHARARLHNLAGWAVWADDELEDGERTRWGRSNAGYRRAAVLLARRGAGLCLSLGSWTNPWHSVIDPVHHDNTRCTEGNNVESYDRRTGTGGKPLCQQCHKRNLDGQGLCPTRVSARRYWCGVHEQRHSAARASDERSMRTLLAEAARAL